MAWGALWGGLVEGAGGAVCGVTRAAVAVTNLLPACSLCSHWRCGSSRYGIACCMSLPCPVATQWGAMHPFSGFCSVTAALGREEGMERAGALDPHIMENQLPDSQSPAEQFLGQEWTTA